MNRRNELRFIELKELIQKHNHIEIFEDIKNEELLVFLIREGHIDENYRHYISHFYPGAISQEDMKFLRSVKNHAELNYDYKLDNIEEIIKDISTDEFKSKSVLNNRLLDYIFDNIVTERARFNIIFDGLIKDIDSRINFIDQFCESSKYDELLINEVCILYPGFWDFIITQSNFTDEKISAYFKRIINACDEGIIIAMDMHGNIKNYIENNAGIFQIDFKVDVEEKFKNIIRELDIKFNSLKQPKVKYSIVNQELEHKFIMYMLEKAMFKMNENMIRYLYGYLVDYTESKLQLFDTRNYSSIKMLGNINLMGIIDKSLSDYLNEVFLKLPDNTKEDLKEIVNLLGVPEVEVSIKIKIIKKSDFIISDLKSTSSELWDEIIECGKWEITWYNVACYFEKFDMLNELMLEQLNKVEIYEKLSSSYIDEVEEITTFSQDVLKKLYQYLYENNMLTDQCLTKIQNSIPESYDYSESNKLSSKRMQLLLENDCVEFTQKNFIYLKNSFHELYYNWSIRNFEKLLEHSSSIALEFTEIKKYLADSKISNSNKVDFINAYRGSIMLHIENIELRELVFKLKDEPTINNLDVEVFGKLMDIEDDFDDKLILLANRVKNLPSEDIRIYLRAIGEPISILSENSNVEGKISIPKKSKSITRLLNQLVDCKYIQDCKEDSKGYEIVFPKND